MSLRDRTEGAFSRWADLVVTHRKVTVGASLFLVAFLSMGLPQLEIETSFDSYLPIENPAQQLYQDFRREFGSGERIVILLRPDEVYEPQFLDALTRLHDALEEGLPYLDDLTSLVNARHLVGGVGMLESVGLLKEPLRDEAGMARLRQRVESNPLYRNILISADQSATALIIELDGSLGDLDKPSPVESVLEGFDDQLRRHPGISRGAMLTTEQSEHLVQSLEGILSDNAPPATEIFVAGTPLLAHRLGMMLTRDIFTFVTVSLVLTALLLFALFRNVWATIHPLLIVGLSVAGTLGWMGLTGVPITAVTEILPSLLVAIGIGDAIHIQAMFYKQREAGGDVPASIRWAMGHSGLAVTLTSLTTAASMAAFQSAELKPIIDLGRVAPFGVALALLLSMTLLPALLSITPMDKIAARGGGVRESQLVDLVLSRLGRVGTQSPVVVILVTGLLLTAAVAGAIRLRFSQDDLQWLPANDPVRLATEELNRVMGGAEPFELYVTLDDGLDLREPEVLGALQHLEERLSTLQTEAVRVAQSLSLVDILEETHRALGDNPDSGDELPDSRAAVSQELLLFESAAPDDLSRLVDAEWRKTRIAMTVPFADALYYPRFAAAVSETSEDVLRDHGLDRVATVEPTGLLMVAGEAFSLLFTSMVRSYAIAFGVIALLMFSLIGNLRLGLISSVPNVAPIVVVMGLMGWMNAPLDISSLLVGGIMIGVVVDDTIHFAHNFSRYRAQTGCSIQAIEETLATTGRAMLVTSLVLSIGFFSFIAASLSNIAAFGFYCGIGVILAFLGDVVLFSALIVIASPCQPECPCRQVQAALGSGAA